MNGSFETTLTGEIAYRPARGTIAGVDLIGYRQDNGSINIGSENGDNLPNFPEEIIVDGMIYTLETITENADVAVKNGKPLPDGDPRRRICWGNYC